MKAMLRNDKWMTITPSFIADSYYDEVKRKSIDALEARDAFDFMIKKCPSYTNDGREIPKNYHLRRTDDDSIISCHGVGGDYIPIQHINFYDYIRYNIFPKIPSFTLESVGTLNGGGTGVIIGRIGDEFSIDGDNSSHEMRIFFVNETLGHNNSFIEVSTVRLACQNQVLASMRNLESARESFHVYQGIDGIIAVNAIEAIERRIEKAKKLIERERALAGVEVGEREVEQMLDYISPIDKYKNGSKKWLMALNRRNEVIHYFYKGQLAKDMPKKTAWLLFNSLTYSLQNPKCIGIDTDIEQIKYISSVGSRADMIYDIFCEVESTVGLGKGN